MVEALQVLEIRPESILVLDGADFKTYPNTQYWALKLNLYNGNRIMYKFEDGTEIIETYDNQIFNCTVNNELIQIRQNGAEALCLAIQHHIDTKDDSLYKKLFLNAYNITYKDKLIQSFLKAYPMVSEVTDGFIVSDFFKVDRKGTTWYKNTNGDWSHLCTVLQDHPDDQVIQTIAGDIELDVLAQTILSKILFLLHPNLKDSVFMNQLPGYIKDELQRNSEQKTKNIS